MIDYSFIISYRDREEHLAKLLPRLKDLMKDTSYEILVVEQDDTDKFQKNSLYNLAARRSNGRLLVFHDVDYYPADDVTYETEENIPYYPVGRVVFLDEKDQPKSISNVPGGYQNFHNNVGDHSGGVFVLSKTLFERVGGLNPYYKGWGKEDDDTRDRLRLLGYTWIRNEQGLFYALHHADNHPGNSDQDFINNHILLSNIKNTLHLGYANVTADVVEFQGDSNLRWLKIKNFKYEDSNSTGNKLADA
jgi:predicted nuclease of predicted toxin-antitoxin system